VFGSVNPDKRDNQGDSLGNLSVSFYVLMLRAGAVVLHLERFYVYWHY
jgi:hypothetical protein